MNRFVALKIHYDHRSFLAPHLKYSTLPTLDQYREYLSLFRDEGIGGDGFHECLNFAIPESGPVHFYLPPTCIPAKSNIADEFVVFSFTYKGDRDLSAHIVGVHAGVQLLSTEPRGLPRDETFRIEGVEPLQYHAEAPADLVTLLVPPLKYGNRDGIYTPVYQTWGYGLRYIEELHAATIISASFKNAELAMQHANLSERIVIQRQIEVLRRIDERYSLGSIERKSFKQNKTPSLNGGLPDKEIGYLGEKFIYEREIAYVQGLGRDPKEVEWISQSVPTSPFDIKTIRDSPDGVRDHFIEVKSSGAANSVNVYISSGQIAFFEDNESCATFALVRFDFAQVATVRDLTLGQLRLEFELIPIKFKLANRANKAV